MRNDRGRPGARPSRKVTPGIFHIGSMVAIGLVGVACASNRQVDVPAGEAVESAEEVQETVPGEPELEVHRGTLARTVEEGGWLLKTSGREYLLLSTSSYRREPWFQEGAEVEVKGREAAGVMTIYMQGTPFRVSSMGPLSPAQERQR